MNWEKVITVLENTTAPLTPKVLARALRAGYPVYEEPSPAEWLLSIMELNNGRIPQDDVFAAGRKLQIGPKLIMDAAASIGVRVVTDKKTRRVDFVKSLAIAAG